MRQEKFFGGASVIYDRTNPKDIERYAQGLVGRCSGDFIPDGLSKKLRKIRAKSVKGQLGQLIEEYYFGKKPNNKQAPDFIRAGVELKTTPVKSLKRGGYSAKERLVLGIIDYNKMAKENFKSSSFYKKNALLLLIFYLFEDEKHFLDFIFKLAKMWSVEDEDLKIIKDDWLKIRKKIRSGKAHEISEGDTLYLGACTKGASSKTLREQPYSKEKAKQRALSLKQGFMSSLFNRLYEAEKKRKKKSVDVERAVKSIREYKKGMTFEDTIVRRFEPFIGMTSDDIYKKLHLDINKTIKNYYANLARRIMGVKTRKIEEFEKAGVLMKTIRLKKNGVPKEDMSFPTFKYTEIIKEKWDESNLKEMFERRFFFVVYQFNENDELVLKKVMFWTIPIIDLDTEVKKVWEKTVALINSGSYGDNDSNPFPKKSENLVSHIRPHGRNKNDTYPTPQGGRETKRCFWLNAKYIRGVIKQN